MRPSLILLPAALSLAACERRLDLSCEHDPHGWWDNPTYTMLHAAPDGGFDFDPVGDPVVQRAGSYDLADGDFKWVDAYDSDHYLVSMNVSGYGTIADDGDLDVRFKRVVEDILDDVTASLLRVERQGCEGTLSIWDFDADLGADDAPPEDAGHVTYQTEIVSDDEVAYSREDDLEGWPLVETLSMTPDVSTRHMDYASGGYVLESERLLDGTGNSWWAQYASVFGGDYDYQGDEQYYFDGSYDQLYGAYEPGTDQLVFQWSLSWTYEGSATGTFTRTSDDLECDVTVTASGECTAECNDGKSYEC